MRNLITPHGLRLAASSLALGLLLAGCASTHGLEPKVRALDGDTLSSNRSLAEHKLSAADFPRQDWWTAFGDAQLDALIDEALQGNPSLDAADARLRKAQAQAGLADAARKPTVTASGQYSGVQLPATLLPPPEGGSYMGSTVLMLNFKYDLDLWGGKRAQWEAAVGQAQAAEVDAQAARLTLSSNIARAYVNLAQAYAALDVANDEHDRATHLRGLGEQRVKAGLDNQLQLRQAESTIASAEQQAQAAQQQIDAARTAIAALMGQGPDRGLDIARPQVLQAGPPGIPDVLPSELLGHRPDVVAARWRVEAASRGIDASKASFKPSVNLSAIVGLASGGLSDLFSSDALLGLGGPAISLPIFDSERLRGQLDASDADYDLAVANYNQILVGALHEVTDALQAARSLEQQIDASKRARAAAQSAWDLAQSRYRAGLGTQLDVLSAQRPLLQSDQQIAMLQAQRLNAAVDLDRALGGGLVLQQPNTPIANTVVSP
ncbi:efflux transporter outer membrane subunit [Pseudoxanthomonas sacheonensis]|uniref:NodT family efflux transporter outer membrane factor (OMF) lipoprotein n=1 Tax=Pseudoxanthomonas sacheonensis TaxID=443615 RepID=A0ABU1RNC4_9GAMM|nr:efflux transporter outer membrane subunit [Pseudoxanthomonas sacheonensis]MDR6840277.1 NodT family efflux transporter outer membrane factor (OMF) lipoprotein [Pseudoxanthomonas sacheonensis]